MTFFRQTTQGILGIAFMACMAGGCFRQEVQTLIVQVPQMSGEACSRVIQTALASVDGLQSAQADLDARTITVKYDSSKIARRNIEFVIAGAGFDANDIPARAPLPATCK